MLKSILRKKRPTPAATAEKRAQIYVKMPSQTRRGAEKSELFIGLAFHTIFVIFLSAQTNLIIIIFYVFIFSLFSPPLTAEFISLFFLNFPREIFRRGVKGFGSVFKFQRKHILEALRAIFSSQSDTTAALSVCVKGS